MKIPFGATVGSFSSFSELWSVRHMAPSSRECRLIQRVVVPSSLNFDVGANVGGFTLAMAKACPAAEIHSFEPAPDTFDRLCKNIALNGVPHVHSHRVAMGSKPGLSLFHVDPNSPATNHLRNERTANEQCIEVEVQTVDATIQKIGQRSPGLLKIDVEGFECEVLLGAAESIQQNRWAAVLIEVCPSNLHRTGRSVGDLISICDSLGCALFELTEQGHPGRELSLNDLRNVTFVNALVARKRQPR
ncbi:MAG TPA: FkbM family methyltransferase [Candidatus Limnocylindria bacterium]|nr:FkbM family methyltransferase [Candidatus Limnocylindria bacterium]